MFSKIFKLITPIQWIELIVIFAIVITVVTIGGEILDSARNLFGLDTKESLKQVTVTQKETIKVLDAANKDLVKDLDTKIESSKIDLEIVTDKLKMDSKIDSTVNKIKETKQAKITEIKSKFKDKPVTVENTKEEEKQISLQQINSLWDVFCIEDSNSVQCTNNQLVTQT